MRFVTVNMFETVFNDITWDIHGSAPFSPIKCYSDLVGPMFDNAYSSLLEDLSDRGLLDEHAGGGHGRVWAHTPNQPRRRARPLAAVLDHGPGRGRHQGRPGCGRVGRIGGAPKDRPVMPAHVAATVYKCLGIPIDTELKTSQGRVVRLVDHGFDPIDELLV